MENRKKDHIELAFQSQTLTNEIDNRFFYEPMISAHPVGLPGNFFLAGKKLKAPIWISSMTGGTELAGRINNNLARAASEFGLGMGLGSCRIILDDNKHLPDFNVRDTLGKDLPLFANLGIAQLEELILKKELGKIDSLLSKLRADGLIIHVNPLQEWFQPEGDRLRRPPLESIEILLKQAGYPIIVKEVGQGMGFESLRALLELPLESVEFAAFGGTNFAKVELLRTNEGMRQIFEPISKVGHDATDMTEMVNSISLEGKVQCKNIIISGGIRTFLDGYYLIRKSLLPAIYGQASGFLKYAREDYEQLRVYTEYQVKGLEMAYAFLRIKE
jgi:isopentenyl-diphosphate delta-isomerase